MKPDSYANSITISDPRAVASSASAEPGVFHSNLSRATSSRSTVLPIVEQIVDLAGLPALLVFLLLAVPLLRRNRIVSTLFFVSLLALGFLFPRWRVASAQVQTSPTQVAMSQMAALLGHSLGNQWYVAPNGTPTGDGSINKPWDLQTALKNPPSVHANDVIWVRGGTYTGSYLVSLAGAPGSPIIVRAYPGERATIDGGKFDSKHLALLEVRGNDNWIWGLEVFSSYPKRVGYGCPPAPESCSWSDSDRGDGADIYGVRNKLINIINHDNLEGYGSWQGVDTEIYGGLIYYNGWTASDRTHGHAIYMQNPQTQGPSSKLVEDTIAFSQFDIGQRVYGSGNAYASNVSFIGNVSVNEGAVGWGINTTAGIYNYLMTVGSGARNIVFNNNYSYFSPKTGTSAGHEYGMASLGYFWTPKDINIVAQGNYFVRGRDAAQILKWDQIDFSNNTTYSEFGNNIAVCARSDEPTTGAASKWSFGNNTYYGSNRFRFTSSCLLDAETSYPATDFTTYKTKSGLDKTSTAIPGRPSGVWTIVQPNKYEPGRANIIVDNWDLKPQVSIDLSTTGLQLGQQFVILDAQNFYGQPVVSGTYAGGAVTIPTNLTQVALPVGNVEFQVPNTAPEFLTLELMPTTAGSVPPPPALDSIPPTVPQNLHIATNTSAGIALSWSPSTDNVGVAGYKVYRNGSPVGTAATASYNDSGITPGTTYSYNVAAFDAAGNLSAESTAVSATTAMVDVTPPTASITAPANGLTVSGAIQVSVSASDNFGVTKVQLFVDNVQSYGASTAPYLCQLDTTSLINGNHVLQARAYDAAGNMGASNSVTINVANGTSGNTHGGGQTLYNGIQLDKTWPPAPPLSQQYQVPYYVTNPPAVIPIDIGRQLFVDDFLIQQTTLTRTQHLPVMYSGNPIFTPGRNDTGGLAMPYSDGVWFDPADSLFKMWYMCGANRVGYAYSNDGMNWIRPSISDAVVPGTNVVLFIGSLRDSDTVWMDLNDIASKKFKLFATYPVQGPNGNERHERYWTSPDGIHWTEQTQYTIQVPWSGDRSTIFYNPFRNVWVNSARDNQTLPAAGNVPQRHIRVRDYAESTDLFNWTPVMPKFWTAPDSNDPAYPRTQTYPELYNLDGTPYESLMVGLFSMYYADNPDVVELQAGFSRDGYTWARPARGAGAGQALIPASDIAGTWNQGNTQSAGGGFLVVGDNLYFYFSGRNGLHNNDGPVKSTGLAMLRRDGFDSMDAAGTEGTLTTRPVTFSGSHLFVNVDDPTGSLLAEVEDVNGNVIAPFTKANSDSISVDKTLQEITWGGRTLSQVANQPVRIKFYLTRGSLYSFWVTSDSNGASHGYVAAGGPGFTGPTDTVGKTGGPASPTVTAAPVLSPAGGTFTGSVNVAMTSPTSNATIYYTSDGRMPDTTSPVYSHPMAVTSSATVRAMAKAPGMADSGVTASSFTITGNSQPPVRANGQPSGVLAAGSSQTTISLQTNENATCRYDVSPGMLFAAMRNAFAITGGTAHSSPLTGLANGTAYTYFVKCSDTQGNANTDDYPINFSVASPQKTDTTAPSVPSGLTAGTVTDRTATFSWSPSTDNSAVAGYYIYRNGTRIGASASTSFTDTGLSAGTTYYYSVCAYDPSGNVSAQSSPLQVITQPATVAPAVSVTSPVNGAVVSGRILITATGSASAGVKNVQFTLDGGALGAPVAVPPYQISWDSTGAQPGSRHVIAAVIHDLAGNTGLSPSVSVTIASAVSHKISLVQSARIDAGTASVFDVSEKFLQPSIGGDFLVVWVRWDSTDPITVVDTRHNTLVPVSAPLVSANHKASAQMFYAANVSAGQDAVIATLPKAATHLSMAIYEYAGIASANPLEAESHQIDTASLDSGSISTTNSNDLIFAATSANGADVANWGAALPYTLRWTLPRQASEDAAVSTAGSYHSAFTAAAGSSFTTQIVAFRGN